MKALFFSFMLLLSLPLSYGFAQENASDANELTSYSVEDFLRGTGRYVAVSKELLSLNTTIELKTFYNRLSWRDRESEAVKTRLSQILAATIGYYCLTHDEYGSLPQLMKWLYQVVGVRVRLANFFGIKPLNFYLYTLGSANEVEQAEYHEAFINAAKDNNLEIVNDLIDLVESDDKGSYSRYLNMNDGELFKLLTKPRSYGAATRIQNFLDRNKRLRASFYAPEAQAFESLWNDLTSTEKQDESVRLQASKELANAVRIVITDAIQDKGDAQENAHHLYHRLAIRVPLKLFRREASIAYYMDELGGHYVSDEEYLEIFLLIANRKYIDVGPEFFIQLAERHGGKPFSHYLKMDGGKLQNAIFRSNDISFIRQALAAGVAPSGKNMLAAYVNFGRNGTRDERELYDEMERAYLDEAKKSKIPTWCVGLFHRFSLSVVKTISK